MPEPESSGPLRVTLDRLIYRKDAMGTAEGRNCFVYFISIHNDGPLPVTIKGRKWVVTDSEGEVTAVEGDGVVGQFPTIEPGEKFTYNSFHLLATGRGVAEGSYLALDSIGKKIVVRIPRFTMEVPRETEASGQDNF